MASAGNPQLNVWYGAKQRSATPSAATPGTGDTNGRMKIAIQGEPGSFSHEAAMKLVNDALIERVAKTVTLPVNVMVTEGLSPNDKLADLGVARISYGPIPYIRTMEALGGQAKATSYKAWHGRI